MNATLPGKDFDRTPAPQTETVGASRSFKG